MGNLKELELYNDFNELANDVLALATEILPDKLIFLTTFSNNQQIILKLSDTNTSILLTEGMALNIDETACNRIDFGNNRPLIFNDTRESSCPADLSNLLESANIRSYMGLPISLVEGERFGTLCAAHHQESYFDEKSIELLQKIAKMFSYYLSLEYIAFRDPLTDLYNRRYLSKFFSIPSATGGVLFSIDLDGFKNVNDVHGHETGDFVLKEVAFRLKKFINEYKDEFAVRLGGDEFLVHFPQILSKAEIRKQAEDILESLSTWNPEYQLSASMGIVTYSKAHDIDVKVLLKNADNALYCAKNAGKNTYKFFGDLHELS
ncbi:sensor domain-containing diguanylate cyclase [Solibacillus sp. FSL W7-1464]|uniref:sensor domain-containing diguanylate cyclase n=1 Tax=Solibacillus sp. FSL W7-1464 TaxID=2921706 RepID=UPI0030FC30B2